MRECVECGAVFSSPSCTRKACSPECLRAYKRRYHAEYRARRCEADPGYLERRRTQNRAYMRAANSSASAPAAPQPDLFDRAAFTQGDYAHTLGISTTKLGEWMRGEKALPHSVRKLLVLMRDDPSLIDRIRNA